MLVFAMCTGTFICQFQCAVTRTTSKAVRIKMFTARAFCLVSYRVFKYLIDIGSGY